MKVTSSEDVTVELEGAHVTIPGQTVAAMWLERLRHDKPIRIGTLPPIGTVLMDGTIFMGIVRDESYGADRAVIDLGEAPRRMAFADATKWAADRGGQLPTRRAQALMFANRAEGQYKSEYYWSCEPYEGADACAWFQGFGNGYQSYVHKDYEYDVRAVRLVDPSMIR